MIVEHFIGLLQEIGPENYFNYTYTFLTFHKHDKADMRKLDYSKSGA